MGRRRGGEMGEPVLVALDAGMGEWSRVEGPGRAVSLLDAGNSLWVVIALPRFGGQLSIAVESVRFLPPFSPGCQELSLLAVE